MRYLLTLLMSVLLVLPAGARKKQQKVKEQPVVARVALSAPDARRLQYFYMEGLKQKEQGNMSAATDMFQHCLDIDSTSSEALYEISMVKFYLRQDSLGFALLRRASELDPQNPWYLETLASVYLQSEQEDKAIPVLEQMAQLQKQRSDVLYRLFVLQKQRGNTEEAVKALDRIELIEGKNLEISKQKFALYLDKGQQEKAFAELETLTEENPHDMRIPLTLAQEYLNAELPEKAWTCVERVRMTDPTNPLLQLVMLDYYEQTKQESERTHLRDSLLYGSDVPSDLRAAALGVLSNDLRDDTLRNEKMLAVIDTLMQNPNAEILKVRAAYLMQMKADQDSIASTLRELLRMEPDNTAALNYLFEYYRQRLDFEQLAEVCRIGVNSVPDNLGYPFYLALALGQLKQNEEAISVLTRTLDEGTDGADPSVVSDIWALLGDSYHELGRVKEAFAAYDSCLVYRSDNASCLNNYAYYLSLREEDMDKAEQMGYRAVRLEPTNKTYLDTYAWVLFVRGDYSEAKRYIDMVIKPETSDSMMISDDDLHAEVVEHAGDIYAQNGDIEKALQYWKVAQQKGCENASLPKKIKQKKYIK